MRYRRAGSAFGRDVFVAGGADEERASGPQGYSIAAVVLKNGWKSDELGSLLNQLYGGIDDWSEFNPNAGARSFVFWGDRAEEASSLCDAFAYAWTKGADAEYNDVIASSNDASDLNAFAASMLGGEIAVGDSYADKIRNTIFAVCVSEPEEPADVDLLSRTSGAVDAAVRQHRFD